MFKVTHMQGLLGLAEGQVFLHHNHPCWKTLGKDPALTRFNLFQSKDDFNNRRETLINKGYRVKAVGPGSAAKHFVEKGLCEL
jgi:hypothetical protein